MEGYINDLWIELNRIARLNTELSIHPQTDFCLYVLLSKVQTQKEIIRATITKQRRRLSLNTYTGDNKFSLNFILVVYYCASQGTNYSLTTTAAMKYSTLRQPVSVQTFIVLQLEWI